VQFILKLDAEGQLENSPPFQWRVPSVSIEYRAVGTAEMKRKLDGTCSSDGCGKGEFVAKPSSLTLSPRYPEPR
jgi:hypothetical protein